MDAFLNAYGLHLQTFNGPDVICTIIYVSNLMIKCYCMSYLKITIK